MKSTRRSGMVMWADGEFGDEIDFPGYVPGVVDVDSERSAKPMRCDDGQDMEVCLR